MTDGIRAVIFDFGGVLRRTMDPQPRRRLEQQYDLEPGGAEETVYSSPLLDAALLGRVTSEEFWADVGRRLELNEEEITAFYRTFRAGDKVDQELVALIRHLRDEGYRTGLLSNAVDSLARRLQEYGFADAFDATVISALEELMKPDPAIYELMLARLGVTAEETIFIDDWQVNVEAARQVGMRGVHFRGPGPLRKQLRELGIPVPNPALTPLPDVRAVIFDWGGVMEELADDEHAAIWERRLALAPGTLAEALWGKDWRQLEIGEITSEEYIQRMADQLGFPSAEAADRFTDEFYASARLRPEVLAAARALRGRYKVGLLSNAWPDMAETFLEKYGISFHADFDVFINSAEVGLRKPDPAIYALALERLEIAPEQAIFVDDLLPNVDSAREVGIHAIQFVDTATTLAELEALLGHPILNAGRSKTLQIRREKPEDAAGVRLVHEQAFGGPNEAKLVELLREAGKATVSLVAVKDGQVVGHILFSPVTIEPAQVGFNGVGLAPMAILPECQKQGIGSKLIREGLEECRKSGYEVVVVLGHHDYYPRFGFSRASGYGLGNEYDVDKHFMAMELREGALAEVSGTVKYQPEFEEAGC